MARREKHGRVTSSKGDPRESLTAPWDADDPLGSSGGRDDGRPRPELAHRRANRKSAIMSGRTIGEKRERLETRNERAAARKKDKRKKNLRISFTTIGFAGLALILAVICLSFINTGKSEPINEVIEEPVTYRPTIEIIDEDASGAEGKITNRMTTYIGQLERDLRDLNYRPSKAVVPTGSIREVDVYLDGYGGFVKTTIDRGSAETAEDADRLIRYLASTGVTDFQYLDVRLPGRAFWK